MTDRNFYSLTDKVAIVTGAAHGIGAAIAERFLKAGARVVFADIDAEGARERAGQLDGSGERSLVAPVDLTQARQVAGLVDTVLDRFGTVDILVNNAGIAGPTKPLAEVTDEEWDQVMALNLTGV
ncbi:MAG: SDR family NAD(P)-dependent oxidoreductase, partial [Acidobacteriota bacterium]|nr:SDR family NAD(P)-dependent oxidoreductase [Acidobacteriota bacterium]